MSAFYDWDEKPRDKSVPMNLDGLREEAFNAALKLAADKIDSRITEHTRTEIWKILTELKNEIRKEISND